MPDQPDSLALREANQRKFDALYAGTAYEHVLEARGLLARSRREGRWLLGRIRRLTGRRLPPGLRLLELGGGNGYAILNLSLASPGERLVVVDIAHAAAQASQTSGQRVGVATHGVQADAFCLPFAAGTFDVIVARAFLHHLPDLAVLLRETRRVLRPGGWALFFGEPTTVGGSRYRRFKQRYGWLLRRGRPVDAGVQTDRYTRTPAEVRAALEQAQVMGEVVETATVFSYVDYLCRPWLMKAKQPWLSSIIRWALRPLLWLDDVLLRRLLPRWTCEQWVVCQAPAAWP